MRQVFLILLLIAPFLSQSQSRSSIGLLPSVSVTHSWADKTWRLTGQLQSMQAVWNNPGGEPLAFDYDYIRTDLTMALSYRSNPHWSFALGQMTRLSRGELVYRIFQQASFATRGQSVRWGHRFRTDQTFEPEENIITRLRYRVSAEVPLNGQDLNKGEWYLKPGIEQVVRFQNDSVGWEQRFLGAIGHYLNAGNKFEIGVDYRLDDFVEGPGRHRLWTTFSYYLNL